MADGEKVFVADKQTLDEIHTLLLSSEIGLAVLKGLLLESAGDNGIMADSISTLGENIGMVKECITDNTNGLGAIKEAVTGRANETTIVAVKELLENGTNGLNAIKTAVSGRASESTSTAIKGLLENGTYGLNALKNAVTGRANETTVAAVKALLENGTYGLNALKTAIENANKFNNTSAGTLQINSAYTRLGDAQTLGTGSSSSIVYAAYSPELSITGNGQITFYNTNKKYQGLDNGLIKSVDMVIDGCAVPISKVNSGGALTLFYNNAGADTTYHLKKFEFGKSFKCRLGCFGTKSAGSTVSVGCNASADYFIQLR